MASSTSTSSINFDIFNNKWIHTFTPYSPIYNTFLICFHHAGSNYTNFNKWQKIMNNNIMVLAICLPGRMKRTNEPLITSINEISKLLVSEFFIKPSIQTLFSNSTVAFFGHSLGSLLVYDTCIELLNNNLLLPNYIFSCCSSPPNYRVLKYMEANSQDIEYNESTDISKVYFTHKLSDKQFIQVLKNMGGTPNEILNSPEMLEYFLPIIKADFKMVELYNGTNNIVLPKSVKIYIFNGSEDKNCTAEISNGWRQIASDPDSVSIATFNGGHFLVQESTEVQEYISKILTKRNAFLCW